MPNPIKTSADKIVEKHRPISNPESIDGFGIETQTINATRHAILEVEACMSTLCEAHDYPMERYIELNEILQELKSRIV